MLWESCSEIKTIKLSHSITVSNMDSLANITLLLLSLLLLLLLFLCFLCFLIFYVFYVFHVFYMFLCCFCCCCHCGCFSCICYCICTHLRWWREKNLMKSMIIAILVRNNNLYIKSKLRAANKNGFQFLNSMLFQGIYNYTLLLCLNNSQNVLFPRFWVGTIAFLTLRHFRVTANKASWPTMRPQACCSFFRFFHHF